MKPPQSLCDSVPNCWACDFWEQSKGCLYSQLQEILTHERESGKKTPIEWLRGFINDIERGLENGRENPCYIDNASDEEIKTAIQKFKGDSSK